MIESVLKDLEDIRGKRVLLQTPEGLKHKVDVIADRLKSLGNEVFVDIDPCFGACDVRTREAELVGADLIVHVGHAPFPGIRTTIPVRYVEIHLPVDVKAVVRALEKIRGRIALCTTVQYVHALDRIKREIGDRITYGKGTLTAYPGQVLGCDASACNVDADVNVFLGDGLFHPIAMYLAKRRPTYVVSPEGKLRDVTRVCERFERVRLGLMSRAYGAKRWGIVVSTKQGQYHPEVALEIKRRVEDVGKTADVLVCDYFFPDYVRGMPYDVYVFTGCPRVALDDWKNYDKPVITPREALEVIRWMKEGR